MFGTSVALVPTLKKVATDQLVMAPFMSLGIINLVGISQGKRTIEELREKLSLEYVEVLLNGWKLWPVSLSAFEFCVISRFFKKSHCISFSGRTDHQFLLCAVLVKTSLCQFCGPFLEHLPGLENQQRRIH